MHFSIAKTQMKCGHSIGRSKLVISNGAHVQRWHHAESISKELHLRYPLAEKGQRQIFCMTWIHFLIVIFGRKYMMLIARVADDRLQEIHR